MINPFPFSSDNKRYYTWNYYLRTTFHEKLIKIALDGAEINGKIVEVKSIDGFLNEKTSIIVSRITDGTIMVEKHKE